MTFDNTLSYSKMYYDGYTPFLGSLSFGKNLVMKFTRGKHFTYNILKHKMQISFVETLRKEKKSIYCI